MHSSESLDPVRSRLVSHLQYIDCWLADINDALHLLDTLKEYLHNPDRDVNSDRLLALLRVALAGLSGGVDELALILNLSEKAKASPVSPVSPVISPVLTPSDTDTTPDTMTPVTLDQFVAALFPVNGKN
jgi:hypothetical protein